MKVLRLLKRPLVVAAVACFVADFVAFLLFERPGLGIGHGFYLAIACAALGTNALGGVAAGVVATSLYVTGVYLNPNVGTSEIPTVQTGIRLFAYVIVGLLIGHYAARSRNLLARADALADELRILSRRDFLTGLPNQRAFELAVNSRLEAALPFALVICEMPPSRNGLASVDELIAHAERLRAVVPADADIARVTNEQFAVLAAVEDERSGSALTTRIERALATGGVQASGGWATFPRDANDALGLYTAASERLYGRRVAQGPLRAVVAFTAE